MIAGTINREKQIELIFNKTYSGIAGRAYGQEVYREQVESARGDAERLILVFPDHIKRVAASFIQGFFSELKSELGVQGTRDYVEIKASTDELAEKISNRIY